MQQTARLPLLLALGLGLCRAVAVVPPPELEEDDHLRVDGEHGSGILSDHLSRIRESPLRKPSSVSDARHQLQRALQAAWHIAHRFGHTWSTNEPLAASSPPPRERSRASGVPSTRSVNPADFGADPTGRRDSTEAMQQAMAALLNTSGEADKPMANGIVNLGGASIDLAGGQYLISKPLVFPPHVGNAGITSGTLRASPAFPRDKWLVMIGSTDCAAKLPDGKPDQQESCNEFINLEDMLLDAAHVAAGCVRVAHTMGSTIGPAFFCTGFNDVGVQVHMGHEVMVQQAWLAEYYWTEATGPKKQQLKSHSVGIQLNGNDHILTNVIVFNHAHIGVEVNRPANVLQNVHTWNGGGVGILVNTTQARLMGCYLDWNKLVIVDPSETVVENSFFLETNAELMSHRQDLIDGLRFRGNTYVHTSKWSHVKSSIEIDGSFRGGSVEVADEMSSSTPIKLTRARRSLHQVSSTKWSFDFSDSLLLPQIDEVQYSFISDSDSDFVRHLARRPKGTQVVVETDVPASGTVTVEVTQGTQRPTKG